MNAGMFIGDITCCHADVPMLFRTGPTQNRIDQRIGVEFIRGEIAEVIEKRIRIAGIGVDDDAGYTGECESLVIRIIVVEERTVKARPAIAPGRFEAGLDAVQRLVVIGDRA